jgi:hypothetical protein
MIACLLYFVGGGIAVLARWLTTERYVAVGGIVGGLASVLGLLSLARRSLNQEDLAGLELQSLRRIADTSEQIKQLELARTEAQQHLGTLEEQKRQMEFLVQKASLSLFLQEQRRLYTKRVLDETSRNKELVETLFELSSIEQKLTALGEEITNDPNVDLLKRVIGAANSEPLRDSKAPSMWGYAASLMRVLLGLSRK